MKYTLKLSLLIALISIGLGSCNYGAKKAQLEKKLEKLVQLKLQLDSLGSYNERLYQITMLTIANPEKPENQSKLLTLLDQTYPPLQIRIEQYRESLNETSQEHLTSLLDLTNEMNANLKNLVLSNKQPAVASNTPMDQAEFIVDEEEAIYKRMEEEEVKFLTIQKSIEILQLYIENEKREIRIELRQGIF